MVNRRRNKLVVPGSDNIIQQMKLEIAQELGINNYDEIDKGALPARVHGMIGGTMTKRLIELGQQSLLSGQSLPKSNLRLEEYEQDMRQDLAEGSKNAYQNAQSVPARGGQVN